MNTILPPLAAFMGLGGTELIIILVILLLLFGGSKLPGLAKGLGQSIKEFKKASNEEDAPAKPATNEVKKEKPETTKANGTH